MREADIPEKIPTDRTAFHNHVSQSVTDSYTDLKEALLISTEGISGRSQGSQEKPPKKLSRELKQLMTAWCASVRRRMNTDGKWCLAASCQHTPLRLLTMSEFDSPRLLLRWQTWCSSTLMQNRSFEHGGPRGDGERVERKQGELHEKGGGQNYLGQKHAGSVK